MDSNGWFPSNSRFCLSCYFKICSVCGLAFWVWTQDPNYPMIWSHDIRDEIHGISHTHKREQHPAVLTIQPGNHSNQTSKTIQRKHSNGTSPIKPHGIFRAIRSSKKPGIFQLDPLGKPPVAPRAPLSLGRPGTGWYKHVDQKVGIVTPTCLLVISKLVL